MKRIGFIVFSAAALLATAPSANADEYGFLDYISSEGENVSTYEIQQAAVRYGYAICDLYESSQSNSHVLNFMMDEGSMSDDQIALYTVASVRELCPHLRYLLG